MEYKKQRETLMDAYWFAEHGMTYVAISLVDEAFDNYMEFYSFYLTESNKEYALFDDFFVDWVAKIMILFYNGKCSHGEQTMVNLTAKNLNL